MEALSGKQQILSTQWANVSPGHGAEPGDAQGVSMCSYTHANLTQL